MSPLQDHQPSASQMRCYSSRVLCHSQVSSLRIWPHHPWELDWIRLNHPQSCTAGACSNSADVDARGRFNQRVKMVLPALKFTLLVTDESAPASMMTLSAIAYNSRRRPWLDRMTEPTLSLRLFHLPNDDACLSTVPCTFHPSSCIHQFYHPAGSSSANYTNDFSVRRTSSNWVFVEAS